MNERLINRDVSVFIEENYSNYDKCEDVARLDDLYKIVYNEYEDDDVSNSILFLEFDGRTDHPSIYLEILELENKIKEKSILDFLNK